MRMKGVNDLAKVSTNISLDADVKKDAQALFSDFGLDLTTAINLFLRQSIREQRIPFEVKREFPNAETIAAMQEVERMKAHPEDYKSYSSFGDVLKDVLDDV